MQLKNSIPVFPLILNVEAINVCFKLNNGVFAFDSEVEFGFCLLFSLGFVGIVCDSL